ncbi:MAG: segregation/condensation protein A [Phycisphaerales bacterium]|jgi:segregation and condensation protein A|nr:segregation/condensation protein A [Phycisphaerales bacterium]
MIIPQEQFRITLDSFDGPLDLLLYLVRRAEVDIQDIPIAQITNDYLAVLKGVESVDIEIAGEFLVMAANLIEIKSRSLVPAEQQAEDDAKMESEEDVVDSKGELIRQLLAFQRFRTCSEILEEKRLSFNQKYDVRIGYSKVIDKPEEPSLELEDVHILDLSDSYEHIASSIDFSSMGEHRVSFDDIPIELCQEDLLDRLSRSDQNNISLQSTFDGLSLPERVGMFLATLELVRLRRVSVHQDDFDGQIVIELIDAESNVEESSLLEE